MIWMTSKTGVRHDDVGEVKIYTGQQLIEGLKVDLTKGTEKRFVVIEL